MRKTQQRICKIFKIAFLFATLLVQINAHTQMIVHVGGSFCAGATNGFVYQGPGTVMSWSISSGGTIISPSGNGTSAKWDYPGGGAYISVSYYYNGYYSVSYNNITISSSVTPSVSINTNSTSICSGASATFNATPVNGGTSPYYTWYVGGSSVSSGYSNTFTTSSLTNGQQVRCSMYSYASCAAPPSVNSNVVTMSVGSPQTLNVTISGNTSVCQGSGTSLSASVSNPVGTLSYQWKKNGNNVTSDYNVAPNVLVQNTVSNGDVYSCVVSSNGCANPGASNSLTISTISPQTFTLSITPNQTNLCQSASITFTSNANLSANNYQWYMNGSTVPGATGTTFTTTASSVSQLQSVYVTANTSVACATNNPATGSAQNIAFIVNPVVTPSVSISANSTNICAGSLVTFTATPVNGGSSPSYTWYVNGSQVSSGSSNSFSSSSLSNGQQVSCVMNSNAACATTSSATSNTITMTVNPVVTMGVTISGNTNICQGTQASFIANVTNSTGTLFYQWKKNGVNVSSGLQNTLVLNSVANNDVITCFVATDGCASPVTSNALTISIVQPQTFSVSITPSAFSFCQNASVTLTANANLSAYNYQWYANGNAITGATSPIFNTSALSVTSLQSYSVTASTNASCVSNTTASSSTQYLPFVINQYVTPSVTISQPTQIISGSSVTFTANPVNGGSTPSYQWQLNGVNIQGATGSTYTTSLTSGAQYQNIGLIMNSNANCVVNPATASNTIELLSPVWENRTYVSVHTILKKGFNDWVSVQLLPIGDKLQTTTYIDGLARPIQDVIREVSLTANNSWNDLVKHYDYSDMNVAKNFIPYSSSSAIGKFKTTASTDQPAYIQSFFGEPSSAPTYSQTVFDNSPLNRVTKTIAPGSNWGTGSASDYDFNTDIEKVHIWNLDYSNTAIPATTSTQIYPTGSLYKLISTDEKGDQVITYIDFDGRVILKKVQNHDAGTYNEHSGWVCTYYVYDDMGQLRYTITPKAVEWLDNNSWNLSQTVVDGLCYKYVYDERGRVIVKKQPEVDEQYIVYDMKNRPVLTQTANQRKANNSSLANDQWSFTVYDGLGRELSIGLLENNSDRNTIQNAVNNLNNGVVTISAFVGNGNYQSFNADNPVAGSTSSANYLSGNTNITFNSVTLYDNYSYTGVKSFNTTYSFYNNSDPAAEPIVKTNRTTNFITGQKIRVIDNDNNPLNDQFLSSTVYYDENGNTLQSLMDNHKNGVDYQTNQYDFSGKLLSNYTNHYINGGATYTIVSRNVYDRIGRPKELYKSFNGSAFKELAEYNYDELGQIKSKRIDPTSANSQMETQNYSYNINGLLTGINKDYALNNNNYSQWDRYFSEYLGYNNGDNLFATAQYNGNITGVIWRTQGDNTPRKYDYTYDHIGRFTSALFKQKAKPSDVSWSNSNMDFSVYLQYEDGNGNIKSMKQMGVVPGSAGVVTIDDLRYSYLDVLGVSNLKGNKLKQVDDLGNLGSNDGKFGDFKDGNTTQDYDYDKEGNLTQDLNKNIQASGITYNYLNKPIKIILANKSQVEYTYDASGEKLSKKVTQLGTSVVTTTDYIGDFVYQTVQSTPQNINTDFTNKLQFILHEEGRLKMITPVAYNSNNTISNELSAGTGGIVFSSTQHGVFEFFIKDHLGSTRMVLTEEVQKEYYTATMENSVKATEDGFFGRVLPNGSVDQTNELEATRILNPNPATAAWPNHSSDFVKLTGANSNTMIGPNMMLKVMAGDLITTSAKYYYPNNNNTSGSTDPLVSVPSTIINALTSPNKGSVIGKTFSGGIQPNLQTSMYNFLKNTEPSSGNTNAPKAYINIVFLDEQFNFIDKDVNDPGVGTDFMRVSSSGDPNASFPLITQKAPKNGWVFVYLSNESVEPVYFDDFKVIQEHSRISEETHYYPHGLKIASISSQAFNKLDSKYGYQGDYSEDEDETGWNEFDLRNYDPQIGRWTGVDPFDEFASGYVGMGNNSVNFTDPSGGGIGIDLGTLGSLTGSVWADRLIATAGGALAGWGIDKLSGGDGKTGAIIGGAVVFAGTFIPPFQIDNVLNRVKAVANSDVVRTTSVLLGRHLAVPDNVTNTLPPAPTSHDLPRTNINRPTAINTPTSVLDDPRFSYLRVAGSQIGTSEIPGPGQNPQITRYHRIGGNFDGTEDDSWCASFVNYCLRIGNPELGRTNSPSSSSFYLRAATIGLTEVQTPSYGDIMVRSNNGKFNGGQGHVAFIVGRVGDGFAQLGGNQAVPGSSDGTTVNVVLRGRAPNVRYYHFNSLPKIPLGPPIFRTATATVEAQLGTDR